MKESTPINRAIARTARLLPVIAVVLLAFAMSGCDKDISTLEAKEGGRIQMNQLFYQVQLSRILNPKDVEDSFLLEGQPTPAKGESYFGVFMRVDNETSETRLLPIGTDKMKVVDASGKEFEPLEVKGQGWGYAPAPIGIGARIPIPDTPAAQGPTGGGLILFKIPNRNLDNRPLTLEIKGPGGKTGEIAVDV